MPVLLARYDSTAGVNDEKVTKIEPLNRPTNMLFQSYALFPHYNVFKNISYGLEREGLEVNEYQKTLFEWSYPELATVYKKSAKEYPKLNDQGEFHPITDK